jgi:gamma-glutamyl hydrolase
MTARRGIVKIGIFSAPMPVHYLSKAESYLQRDYLDWVEMSGAVPVIIPYNTQYLVEYLNTVNGVMWVGGAIENEETHSQTQYVTLRKAYEHAFKYAIQENQNGNYYPIWGTCLGFDFLALMGQKNHELSQMSKIHKTRAGTLRFKGDSRLRRVFSKTMQQRFAKEPVTRQLHSNGFNPESNQTIHMHPYLKIISVDTSDRSPQKFVNAFEYKHFPFYGTQWHPEKPVSPLSQQVALRLSKFFKKECAKNRNRTNWTPSTGQIKSAETVLIT